MKRILKIIGKVLLVVILLFVALIGKSVFASSIEDSILVKGTENLVNAIISWLTGIGITVCGGYFIYYVYSLKLSAFLAGNFYFRSNWQIWIGVCW